MAIRPKDLIEAFQESEGISFGSRPIVFYENLGYQKKDILELFARGTMEAQSEGDKIVYAIGLTKDEGGNDYVSIIPKNFVKYLLSIKKMELNIIKQKNHNRRYRPKR